MFLSATHLREFTKSSTNRGIGSHTSIPLGANRPVTISPEIKHYRGYALLKMNFLILRSYENILWKMINLNYFLIFND